MEAGGAGVHGIPRTTLGLSGFFDLRLLGGFLGVASFKGSMRAP